MQKKIVQLPDDEWTDGVVWIDEATGKPLIPSGKITTKLREAFEVYEPNTGGKWLETKHASDLVAPDGNAAAASYLVLSKSPLVAGTETIVETVAHFDMPIELAVGASFSQRTLGQEFSIEVVDTGTPLPDIPDLVIASISQTTTTLTIDTVLPHGLSVGNSIGVCDCSDLRANYPALVVASAPSPTQFTCTAGPGGTIASQTITNPVGAKGLVFFRERLGRAQNGVSQIFETAGTNASLYVRSESGGALPSGTIAGAHPVGVASLTSTQLVNSPFTYAFAPASQFQINVQSDRVQWSDIPVDSAAQSTNRLIRTQVCPDPSASYKLRIRATNNKSLTVPSAQIVSAVKSGTTTATIVTDVPHGLAVADPVVVYGVRAQGATEFPNLLTATAVASIISPTSFTIIIGTAGTITSYGGYVAKVQGGNLMSALGGNVVVAQSAVLSTLADGTRQLVLNGNTNWAGLVIGDMAELVGCRNNVDGTTLGLDGPWKVANLVTTVLTLVLPSPGQRVIPADFASVNCGGAIIERTELRISFIRAFDFDRQRIEMLSRPTGDLSAAAPVVLQGGTSAASQSGTWNVATVTTVAAVTNAGTPAAPATPLSINSLATTNGQLVLTGTSGLQALYATNTGAAAAYVKLYNKATAPTVGTDVPAMLIPIPAAVGGVPGSVQLSPGFIGYRFALGLGLAITGGAADNDTAAVAAGQVKINLSRTV